MSIALKRISNFNVLPIIHFSVREGSLNVERQFSLLSSLDINRDLLNNERRQVPFRTFYKHEVEVKKRIQWKRPEKVPCIRPEKSGDLSGLPEVDVNKPPPLFEQSKEYQTANDLVKRVLSYKFQPSSVLRQAKIDAVTQKVKRHQYDNKSVEVKIAKYTAIIRNMQVHYENFPHDKVAKADLKEIIEFRKKRMKLLRSLDYKRFEWLLEQLDLLYKPAPSSHERVERKKSMRWLAAEYIEKVKEKKLEEYRNTLESQKKEFLQRKLSTMKSIVDEEVSCEVEPSFSAEDIALVEDALNKITSEEEKKSAGKGEVKEVY